MLSHVIVFSNRPPIPELAHRDVQEFHIDSYVPPAVEFKETVPCEGPAIVVPFAAEAEGEESADTEDGSSGVSRDGEWRVDDSNHRGFAKALGPTPGSAARPPASMIPMPTCLPLRFEPLHT